LNVQLEQLHQSSNEKEQTIRKLREELIKKDSSLKQNEEMQLAQKHLQEEIDRLQKEIKQQQLNTNQLESIIAQSKEAEKRYQQALQQKKGIYFARMERVSPIYLQIQQIEQKAKELEERRETEASTAAKTLATKLRLEIKNYLDNNESDEKSALNSFKINAKRHIENSKETLNQHREEWKYLLANVTLGVFLLGIGYLAAILINKATTGNYTFFSQTNSGKKLDALEKAISSTHSETLVYG
ncbi:TPA: type IV secretion protein Dot, partial [Legionella pneumophila]|nr:type IV secretion protein Dot [Legionella pneumophila]